LYFLPLFVAGIGLAAQQINASPIRLIVVSSHQEVTPSVRVGHAGGDNANANNDAINMVMPTEDSPCPGKFIHEKAIRISNAFRKALGLPLIEISDAAAQTEAEDLVRIMPFPFIGTPSNLDHVEGNRRVDGVRHRVSPVRHHPLHHNKHHHHKASFMRRVHHALMTLGPWEGRAVAFVLGCGIGVLLRMVWVFAVVTYRLIKGENEDVPEYTLICEHYTETTNNLPPPLYISEKVEGNEIAQGDVKVLVPT